MNPTPCPDCDPHGFDANLETFYGQPLVLEGEIKVYADPRVGTNPVLGPTCVDAKAFARSFCPKHRSTSAKP